MLVGRELKKLHRKKIRTTTRTIRLKLDLVEKDKETYIKDYLWTAPKAANKIMSNQYFNDFVGGIVKGRKLKPINVNGLTKEQKEEIKQFNVSVHKEFEDQFRDFYGIKRQATTERDIKEDFPNLPPSITNRLNNDIVSYYNKIKSDVLSGKRSLSTYKIGMPVPITEASFSLLKGKKYFFVVYKNNAENCKNIKFKVVLGKDRANYRKDLDEIYEGNKKYSAPSLQLKNNKYYCLLPVKDIIKKSVLLIDNVVGVDLGINIPAYVALNDGKTSVELGSAKQFLKNRIQFRNRKRQIQKDLQFVKGGKGRNKKLKGLDRLSEKERHFANTYNHGLSKKIVNFALSNKAKFINLENLKGIKNNGRSILGFWSYFELQNMIEYKSKRVGVEVRYINPKYTSQKCSVCGNIDANQRKTQELFRCEKCSFTCNADLNAAINISRSSEFIKR